MYRKHAGLMQFEQELSDLSRDEVSDLERELMNLYNQSQAPSTAQALLRKNSVYNTDLLEQRLEIVRERKGYLYEKFKIPDQIKQNESDLTMRKDFQKLGVLLNVVMAGVANLGLFVSTPDSYVVVGFGALGVIFGTAICVPNYFYGRKAKAKLKELKESPEYIALQQDQEKDKLLKDGETEPLRLPSIKK